MASSFRPSPSHRPNFGPTWSPTRFANASNLASTQASIEQSFTDFSTIYANSAIILSQTTSPLPTLMAEYTVPPEPDYEDAATSTVSILNNSYVKLTFMFIYCAVFLSCFLGNITILTIIICHRSFRTMTNFFLANLAVADLLVGIFCVLPNGAHFFSGEHGIWHFGKGMCHTYVMLLNMIPNVSAGILVLMSVERYIAVTRPMAIHLVVTRQLLCASAAGVWILSALMNLPNYMASQYISFTDINGQVSTICTREHYYEFGYNVLQITATVNLIVWYIFPLISLFFIYIRVGIVLHRTTEGNAVARSSQGNSARSALLNRKKPSGPSTDSGRHPAINDAVDGRRRVIKLVVVIVLCFALLSLPRYLYLTWSVWRDANSPRCLNCLTALIQPTTFLLMFVNSGVNPILYALVSTRFRTVIKEYLHRVKVFFRCCENKKEKRAMHLPLRHKTHDSDRVIGGRAFALPKPNMLQTHHGVYSGYSPSDSPVETILLA
uniref:G_PROTEIN_RECEP_F1_2 domain-containing protein n=1 Tax=Panagrellus redivivus TaxID=6233 RepID=A0A7E4WC17_PANRE